MGYFLVIMSYLMLILNTAAILAMVSLNIQGKVRDFIRKMIVISWINNCVAITLIIYMSKHLP